MNLIKRDVFVGVENRERDGGVSKHNDKWMKFFNIPRINPRYSKYYSTIGTFVGYHRLNLCMWTKIKIKSGEKFKNIFLGGIFFNFLQNQTKVTLN